MRIAIIIPVLNEAPAIAGALEALGPLLARGCEIIVCDGGSDDGTPALALPLAGQVIHAPRGRSSQMNAGAQAAHADILLFLHADTSLPPDADRLIEAAILKGGQWGRFDVRIEGRSAALPVIGFFMNWRSRLTGVATGDQAIFIRRDVFESHGGFADIALMEDIEISKRLKRVAAPVCLHERVTTSGRRWETYGVLRTILKMWRLRLAYWLGADPRKLARQYGHAPNDYRPRPDSGP